MYASFLNFLLLQITLSQEFIFCVHNISEGGIFGRFCLAGGSGQKNQCLFITLLNPISKGEYYNLNHISLLYNTIIAVKCFPKDFPVKCKVWLNIDGCLKEVIFIPEYHGNIHFIMFGMLVSFLSLMS